MGIAVNLSKINDEALTIELVSDAMGIIIKTISELQAAINDVGVASNEITEIVKLIGSIAEETNLLSLNASIEVARAG